MTPQALALVTAVGPPDCATMALPRRVFMKNDLTTDPAARTEKTAKKRGIRPAARQPAAPGRDGAAPSWRCGLPGRAVAAGSVAALQRNDGQPQLVRQGDGLLLVDEDGLARLHG